MISLGAKDAMNLDGGGSSAMVINRDGKMTAENSGSDGALRRVYNSVIFVKN
jgi:exopolysaccharide biosynthesis protein